MTASSLKRRSLKLCAKLSLRAQKLRGPVSSYRLAGAVCAWLLSSFILSSCAKLPLAALCFCKPPCRSSALLSVIQTLRGHVRSEQRVVCMRGSVCVFVWK
ncbi:hypothetical protein ATANTOWER_018444 [Ataeniobius toweri]|uniref:Uncharacterized protein n=1 Tax=Ataeniobius toweri TaxID=208326 RepID=A0ABU7BHC9_9TELE|nr:hypothetical protein [Ataeniobius toweri]